MKTIKFYSRNNYGVEHEYIHPENEQDRKIVCALTGKKTITPDTRGLITALSGGQIEFIHVVAPWSAGNKPF